MRDDLGKTMDLSSINHESAYTRGMRGGEYTVNAHAYRIDPKRPPPFDVEAVISTKVSSEMARMALNLPLRYIPCSF